MAWHTTCPHHKTQIMATFSPTDDDLRALIAADLASASTFEALNLGSPEKPILPSLPLKMTLQTWRKAARTPLSPLTNNQKPKQQRRNSDPRVIESFASGRRLAIIRSAYNALNRNAHAAKALTALAKHARRATDPIRLAVVADRHQPATASPPLSMARAGGERGTAATATAAPASVRSRRPSTTAAATSPVADSPYTAAARRLLAPPPREQSPPRKPSMPDLLRDALANSRSERLLLERAARTAAGHQQHQPPPKRTSSSSRSRIASLAAPHLAVAPAPSPIRSSESSFTSGACRRCLRQWRSRCSTLALAKHASRASTALDAKRPHRSISIALHRWLEEWTICLSASVVRQNLTRTVHLREGWLCLRARTAMSRVQRRERIVEQLRGGWWRWSRLWRSYAGASRRVAAIALDLSTKRAKRSLVTAFTSRWRLRLPPSAAAVSRSAVVIALLRFVQCVRASRLLAEDAAWCAATALRHRYRLVWASWRRRIETNSGRRRLVAAVAGHPRGCSSPRRAACRVRVRAVNSRSSRHAAAMVG